MNKEAVHLANAKLWKKYPELNGRELTTKSNDAAFRKEWMELYEQENIKSKSTQKDKIIPAITFLSSNAGSIEQCPLKKASVDINDQQMSFSEFTEKILSVSELIIKNEKLSMISDRQNLPTESKVGTFKEFSEKYMAFKDEFKPVEELGSLMTVYSYYLKAMDVLSDIENKDKLYNFYVESGKTIPPLLLTGAASLFFSDVVIYSDLSSQLGIDKAIVNSPIGDRFTTWLSGFKPFKN